MSRLKKFVLEGWYGLIDQARRDWANEWGVYERILDSRRGFDTDQKD